MAAQYKTKCPHCGAQFRIGQDHLKQAGGKVRCGSCLEIFLATENLVKEGGETPAKAAKPGKTPAKPKKPVKKQPAPAKKQKAEPADEPRWTPPKQDTGRKATPDESKDKKRHESNDTGVSLGSSELSESFLSMDEENGFGDDNFVETREGSRGDSDESWAEQLLEELEDNEQPEQTAQEPPSPENMSLLDEWSGDEEDAAPPATGRSSSYDEDDGLDMFAEDPGIAGDDELDVIEIPPPEEEPEKPPRLKLPRGEEGPGQWFKWGALSLAAALVLAGQYLAFNFRELARTPQWRPYYAAACDVLGCQLPHRSNITRLRGANLVVRNHPSVAGALVVDAIVFNEADYPQPFPVLELSFSSAQDKPIASRRFTPSEYRAGELKDLAHMPPDVPIHVSLEILDPGPDAVNYSLRFRPAPEPDNAG